MEEDFYFQFHTKLLNEDTLSVLLLFFPVLKQHRSCAPLVSRILFFASANTFAQSNTHFAINALAGDKRSWPRSAAAASRGAKSSWRGESAEENGGQIARKDQK